MFFVYASVAGLSSVVVHYYFVTSDHDMCCSVPTLHAYGARLVVRMRDVKTIICHFETN